MASEKPYKGEIHVWTITKHSPDTWVGAALHNGYICVAWGYRNGKTPMHTSPIVSFYEPPRHKGDVRIVEIETENSRYKLVGEGNGF